MGMEIKQHTLALLNEFLDAIKFSSAYSGVDGGSRCIFLLFHPGNTLHSGPGYYYGTGFILGIQPEQED